MPIKITIYKHWEVQNDATYHIECVQEVDAVEKVPTAIGELLGALHRQPLKKPTERQDKLPVGPGRPPLKTIKFDAPATEGQMENLRKAAVEHLKRSDEESIQAYLKTLFGVSKLDEITRGMAADFLTGNREPSFRSLLGNDGPITFATE